MDALPLSFFATAADGGLRGAAPGTTVTRVVTDSRTVRPGDLFVALKGDRFDAHDFLVDVAARGATAAVVSRDQLEKVPAGLAVVVVDDTKAAYGRMAAAYRRQFDIPVVCVGGSNGKTTTKEIIAALLGMRFRVLKSEASFNNDVGVPATLFLLDAGHRAAVLEAGTNHPGELAPLVRMIAPRIGVITSIGREHLEHFGDLAGVVAEEGALAELLPSAADGGVLVINGACAFHRLIASRTQARVVTVGHGAQDHWRAEVRSMTWERTTFHVTAPRPEWCGVHEISLPGRHSVPNAQLGLAVAFELGMSPSDARDGLAGLSPVRQRLTTLLAGGVRILDDTYNANADSVLAALQTLADLPCTGRRVAVLGGMAELGRHTEDAHAEVGRAAARLGIDAVFAIGEMAPVTAAAAGSGRATSFATVEAAAPAVLHFLQAGDSVLVKASRSARLERIVGALRGQLELRPVWKEAA